MPKLTSDQTWHPDFIKHPLFNGFKPEWCDTDCATWPDISQLNQIASKLNLVNSIGLPIQFAQQDEVKGQRAYEHHIHTRGIVPTRPKNWHDFLNACVWFTFPKIKAALNNIHFSQPTDTGRTLASDAATVFDESGAILIGPDARLAQWLVAHDWQRAFVTERHLWQHHRLLIIGHAVLEKSLNPYPGMIAKVLYHPTCDDVKHRNWATRIGEVDAAVANRWAQHDFDKPSKLFALPVMGVPGVDPANKHAEYYDNKRVFRI